MMSNTDTRLRGLLPLSFIKSISSDAVGDYSDTFNAANGDVVTLNLFPFSQSPPGHPHFFNQLSCGLDIVSMAGEWLTATANTNMFTYEIAPVFILMETVVLSKMRDIIGYPSGDSILAPGGSISNLYAFLAARHKMFPGYKEHGPRGLPGDLVMFTSDQCHYSIKSCASVCGLGTENCVYVPSDEHGKMIPSELERCILERKNRGQIPFFVNATAGTTVLGAFDPLNEIADICQKFNCWFHIDVSLMKRFSSIPSAQAATVFLVTGCMGRRIAFVKETPTSSIRWSRKVRASRQKTHQIAQICIVVLLTPEGGFFNQSSEKLWLKGRKLLSIVGGVRVCDYIQSRLLALFFTPESNIDSRSCRKDEVLLGHVRAAPSDTFGIIDWNIMEI